MNKTIANFSHVLVCSLESSKSICCQCHIHVVCNFAFKIQQIGFKFLLRRIRRGRKAEFLFLFNAKKLSYSKVIVQKMGIGYENDFKRHPIIHK
jgi:hypothetical protein